MSALGANHPARAGAFGIDVRFATGTFSGSMGEEISNPSRDRALAAPSRAWRSRVTGRLVGSWMGLALLGAWSVASAQPGAEASTEADGQPPAAPSSAPPTTSFPEPATPAETPPGATSAAPAAAAAAPSPSAELEPGAPITPELLALCTSSDPAARRYCLTQLERAPELPPAAQAPLAELAASDPSLSARARALHRQHYGTEPAAPPPPPAEPAAPSAAPKEAELPPGDPMRVLYSPTAFTRPARVFGFNAFELGTLTFDYGATKNVEVGIQTAIPIGFVSIGGLVKVGAAWDGGAVAVRGNVLAVQVLESDVSPAVVYGAGPMFTLGNYERYLNVGAQFYGLTVDGESVGLALPNVGGSVRLTGATRIGAEIYLPAGLDEDLDFGLGEFAVLIWGVRLFGDHIWGDIALIDPFCDGCSDIYSVIPLGIPFLNIGGTWRR